MNNNDNMNKANTFATNNNIGSDIAGNQNNTNTQAPVTNTPQSVPSNINNPGMGSTNQNINNPTGLVGNTGVQSVNIPQTPVTNTPQSVPSNINNPGMGNTNQNINNPTGLVGNTGVQSVNIPQTPVTNTPQSVPSNINNPGMGSANQNINNPTGLVGNTGVQSVNMSQAPVGNTPQSIPSNVNNSGNSKLKIVFIVSAIIAVIAVIVAIVVIRNNSTKPVNDFETNNGENSDGGSNIGQSGDTIEYQGFTIGKKLGYTYKIDDSVLYAYNDSSLFQLNFGYNISSLSQMKQEIQSNLANNGYTPKNSKIDNYDGIETLSFELEYSENKFLYLIYYLPSSNYWVEMFATNKKGTIDYNMIAEAVTLTDDVSKSSTFAKQTEEDSTGVLKVNSKLFDLK